MHFNAASIEGLAFLLLIGLVIAIAAMSLYTIRVLTRPPRRTYASALARNRPGDPGELDRKLKWTAWDLRWRGLDLPVWDIEGEKPGGPIIILSHGWGDSRIGGLSRVPPLAPMFSRLILWDMPGHGESKGTCTLGTHEVDALQALIDRINAPVVLYGWSLGAGVSIAADAGAERVFERSSGSSHAKVQAIIAEAPYRLPETPARNVLRSYALPHRINLPLALWYLGARFGVGPRWKGFDRAALAARLQAPLLVIHGAEDLICPVEDGQRIAGSAKHGTLVTVPGGGHHSLWTEPMSANVCAVAVNRFLFALRQDGASAARQADLPELPAHWRKPGTSEADALTRQLQEEMSPDHPLQGTEPRVVLRRYDCDDVLVELKDGRLAIVHLTWSRHHLVNRIPNSPPCPNSFFIESLDDLKDPDLRA